MSAALKMTAKDAGDAGYRPITRAFTRSCSETRMLANVLADMERGHIDHCVVDVRRGVEVWKRKGARA